jgi:hypothetical protein
VDDAPEPELRHRAFHAWAKRAVADEERVHRWHEPLRRGDGVHEVHRVLLGGERRDLHDERRARRDAEGRERRREGRLRGVREVHAARHDGDALARDSPVGERVGGGVGDGDDAVRPRVLEPREDVAAEPEGDAAREDQAGARPEHGERAGGDGVSGVGVDDLDALLADDAPQRRGRGEVELPARRALHGGEPLRRGTLEERLARPRGDDRAVPHSLERRGEQQDLTLAAAPSPLRVDVQHGAARRGAIAHRVGAPLSPVRRYCGSLYILN